MTAHFSPMHTFSANKLAVKPLRTKRVKQQHDGVKYQLALALQETLDVTELLNIFEAELKGLDSDLSIQYEHGDLALYVGSIQKARAEIGYNLGINDMKLGRIVVKRSKRFSDPEVAAIDECVALLVRPLKNALLYQEAIIGSFTDPLTGLFNRRGLQNHLQREKSMASRYGETFSMLMIDVDEFKQVNDTYGHNAGDLVLKEIARVLKQEARDSDSVFRYAGDEFVVLTPKTDQAGAFLQAERIRCQIETLKIQVDGKNIPVHVSIGVAELCDAQDLVSLFSKADQALYAAKGAGRNCVQQFA